MNETTNLSTPVEIDTELARLSGEQVKPQRTVDMHQRYLASKGATPRHEDHSHYFDQVKHDAAQAEVDAFQALIDALNARYTGWPRYFHVTNTNGHIHTSMSCSSCNYDTQFAWRTDLSGLTPEQVVEREAYNACTVCMPIAPVEQRAAREYFNRQQREAKAAAKQAKADDKLKKAAERAIKFLAKVDAQVIASFGSWDALLADYTVHGGEGKKSLYEASYDIPSQVGDYLYDEIQRLQGATRISVHMKDPKVTIAEAREKGLVA